MDPLPEFEEITAMPPVTTFRESGILSLDKASDDSGMGGG